MKPDKNLKPLGRRAMREVKLENMKEEMLSTLKQRHSGMYRILSVDRGEKWMCFKGIMFYCCDILEEMYMSSVNHTPLSLEINEIQKFHVYRKTCN